MNPVLDKAKSHFAEIVNKGMESLDVPEWGTTYIGKTGGLNFASQAKVIELQQAGKTAEALVEMLLMRALDENGKRMFKTAEKIVIMNKVDRKMLFSKSSQQWVKVIQHWKMTIQGN